ncbi:MAG: hypothetical protein E7673_00725 [Ruminococcaceae bacterium]|nr:hypothetical protein [Oscillospiraceae bacterium]
MKLNMKRILSSALVVILLFGTIIGVMPINANAAYTESNVAADTLSEEEAEAYLAEVVRYSFASAEEMLLHELQGIFDKTTQEKIGDAIVSVNQNNSPNSRYALYVNKYTGFVYYQDRLTGQILTSNPYKYPTLTSDIISTNNADMASQLVISYSETTKNTISKLYSSLDAALKNQISVERIANGLRVNYTIGDTVSRYLLPGYITAEKLEKELLVPMLNEFRDLMVKYCNNGVENEDFDIFKAAAYNPKRATLTSSVYYKGALNIFGVQKYLDDMRFIIESEYNIANGNLGSEGYIELDKMFWNIMDLYGSGTNGYSLRNLKLYDKGSAEYESLKGDYFSISGSKTSETLEPIYEFTGTTNSLKSTSAKIFERYINKYREESNPEDYTRYSFTEMYEDEDYCGYVDETDPKPVFRCSLEYSFNNDGSLSVRLPANSISFDKTLYNLDSITVLKYFGAADGTNDGHIFFPDGSGMVLDYKDFYNPVTGAVESTNINAEIYGADNSYSPEVDPSKIIGAYREQVSMPVFGVVGTEAASLSTVKISGLSSVTNGYFAIVENGASLAKLEFQTGTGNTASAFCTYSPYPSDKYDLSNTISVGGADYYTIVSDAKFNGSYVTRYVMLTDKNIGDRIENEYSIGYYESSYSGMAAYYRDYLYDDGTLTALTSVKSNLPLYIEALGSMDIMDKFLTFPVEKSIPLTTFDNVATMYSELRNSSAALTSEMEKYQALANAETDPDKKAEYQALADKCKNFVIDNINFRLTGFGSGGLSSNYPTKLRWEKSCGGKRGFKRLLETAKEANGNGDVFGIYPDYDFMYLSYSAMFDGVSNKRDVSKMIDNRYASKQVYDSISRQYISYFTLVVNPESLNDLYTKFVKKYSKYDIKNISVSTMGSDLNSNFNTDNPINRNDAQQYVEVLLSRMIKQNGYSVMLDMGNAYTIRYATHLLNVATDSSRVKYSSYSVPFIGMILHGAVNYAGKPLNYSGMPEYDLLRSIESGAALYFILCYQNESYMKNDAILNDYFGVSYSSWYNDVVKDYFKLNCAIGDLQKYIISDHKTVIGERVVDAQEQLANYKLLMDEIVSMMDGQIDAAVGRGYDTIRAKGETNWYLDVNVSRANLLAQLEDILNLDLDVSNIDTTAMSDIEALIVKFVADIDAVIAKYDAEYPGAPDSSAKEYGVYFAYDAIPDGIDADNCLITEFLYGLYTADGKINYVLLSAMLDSLEAEIKLFIAEGKAYVDAYNAEVDAYNAKTEAENAILPEGEKPAPLKTHKTFVLNVQRDAILKVMADVCKLEINTLEEIEMSRNGDEIITFGDYVTDIIEKYKSENAGEEGKEKHQTPMNSLNAEAFYLYASRYSFITDSGAFDEKYVYTDYTSDRGNIVLVTYTNGDKNVKFLLNYNIYTVEVKLGNESYKLGKYEYIRIEG